VTNAELVRENERLRGALRLACEDLGKDRCPKDPDAYFGKLTDAHCDSLRPAAT
jgi:hypothetical protein